MVGEYTLNRNQNGIILYCKVKVQIVEFPTEPYELSIELLDGIEENNSRYIIAIKSGIEYFRDFFPKKHFGKTIIKITFFDAREIDTTYMSIIYSVVKALCEAYRIEEDRLNLNEENLTFSFPFR
ncbi:MAG: hypothetical protein V4580_18585 [Bacteroidota bacterium]